MTLMVVNTLFYLIFGVVQIFQCSPIPKAWNPTLDGWCQNINSGLVFSPAVDFALNLAMLLLPIWMLWKLEIKIQKRLRAVTIFAVGIM